MKLVLLFKIARNYYKTSGKRNIVMILLFLLSNIVTTSSLLFLLATHTLEKRLTQSYYEHLSVSVTSYEQSATNHELLNVKKYKRPDYQNLLAIQNHSGAFSIKPDYSYFLAQSVVSFYETKITTPTFVVIPEVSNTIYINKYLADELTTKFSHFSSLTGLHITFAFTIEGGDTNVEINDEFTLYVSKIIDEPDYFLTPKIYITQSLIDEKMNSYYVNNERLSNYLFNLANDHPYTNYSYLCHFNSQHSYDQFKKIISDSKTTTTGLEIAADYLTKVTTLVALFAYLEIVIIIFFVITFIGILTIFTMLITSLVNATLRQSALLRFLGATKGQTTSFFLITLYFNYFFSSVYLLFYPQVLDHANRLIFPKLNYKDFFVISPVANLALYLLVAVIITIYSVIIIHVKFRRQLFYLLIDD